MIHVEVNPDEYRKLGEDDRRRVQYLKKHKDPVSYLMKVLWLRPAVQLVEDGHQPAA